LGLQEVASYSDDFVGAGHLERQVGVVEDGYEHGVAWSAQDGVIGGEEIHYFEGECFVQKLARPLNVTGKSTCLRGTA
jgi:hypothetical protein